MLLDGGVIRKGFPIFVSSNIKLGKIAKNTIEVEKGFGNVRIGFGGVEGVQYSKGYIRIDDNSKIIFKGTARFALGSVILIGKQSTIQFGELFNAGKNFFLSCNGKISFDDDILLGWNVSVRDNDGHTIVEQGVENEHTKPIKIGKHVWIGSDVLLLKGCEIADNNVVATRACVTKQIRDENCIIGGLPARVIKKHIEWRR